MKLDNISYDMNVCLGLARIIAPMETGNLRYNAIYSHLTQDGFVIGYSLNKALYIYFLEEGTRKFIGHMGFIGAQTVPAIASYFHSKYNAKDRKKTNHFIYYSNKGFNEIDRMTSDSEIRLKNSLMANVQDIAAKNNWQSGNIDYFNENYTEKYVTDFVKNITN